jgi:hypothetical protein
MARTSGEMIAQGSLHHSVDDLTADAPATGYILAGDATKYVTFLLTCIQAEFCFQCSPAPETAWRAIPDFHGPYTSICSQITD